MACILCKSVYAEYQWREDIEGASVWWTDGEQICEHLSVTGRFQAVLVGVMVQRAGGEESFWECWCSVVAVLAKWSSICGCTIGKG